MTKISPMDVISRCTLVLYLLHWLGLTCSVVFGFGLVRIFRDLQAIIVFGGFGHTRHLDNVRLITNPSHATASQEPIFHGITHGASKVGVMLNLKVQCTLNQFRCNTPDWVIVAKPTADISLWHLTVNSGNQGLYV